MATFWPESPRTYCPQSPDSIGRQDVLQFVQPLPELLQKVVDIIHEAQRNVYGDAPGPKVVAVHPSPPGPFVELHELLAFFEQPKKGGHRSDV